MRKTELILSIIIPVYNVEKYLTECIDSVINQGFFDIEIICINDGSTDKSGMILKEYAKRDSRIRVIEQENKGLSSARNVGVEMAEGKYILFLDSDDKIADGALEKIAKYMESAQLDMLCYSVELIDETCGWSINQFEKYKMGFQKKGEYRGVNTGKQLFVEMQSNRDFQHPVCFFCIKREILMDNYIRFEKDILHEDAIYTLLCYLNSEKVLYVDEKYYMYRIHNNTLSRIKGSKWRLESLLYIYYLLLEQIRKYEKEQDVVSALCDYTKEIIFEIQKESNKLLIIDDGITQSDNNILDLLYCGTRTGQYKKHDFDKDLYIKGFIGELDNADNIFLYGAGEYGQIVLKFLESRKYEKKLAGFIVSNNAKKNKMCGKYPIYTVNELSDEVRNDTTLVIISVDVPLHDQLKEICIKSGFSNVVALDFALQAYVEQGLLGM